MTPEEILAVIAPELYANISAMTVYIALATQKLNYNFFGDTHFTMAIALLSAHMWVLNTKRGGQSGVITYEGAGRMLRSFGGVGVIREEYDLTNYGMQLKGLIHTMGHSITTSSVDIFTAYLG